MIFLLFDNPARSDFPINFVSHCLSLKRWLPWNLDGVLLIILTVRKSFVKVPPIFMPNWSIILIKNVKIFWVKAPFSLDKLAEANEGKFMITNTATLRTAQTSKSIVRKIFPVGIRKATCFPSWPFFSCWGTPALCFIFFTCGT